MALYNTGGTEYKTEYGGLSMEYRVWRAEVLITTRYRPLAETQSTHNSDLRF